MGYYSYSSFNPWFALLMGVVALFGLASCFFGFKIQKFFICLETAIVFSVVGIILAYREDVYGTGLIIAGVVMAIIGGFLGYTLFKIFVVLISGVTGYVSMLILSMLITGNSPNQFLAILCGLVLAVLSAFLIKPIFIISTAISGGILAGYGIYAVFEGARFMRRFLVYGSLDGDWGNTLGILLVIAGLVFQIITNYDTKELMAKANGIKQRAFSPVFNPTTVPSQTTVACSNCNWNNIYDEKNRFCEQCGAKLQPPRIPDKYCAYCGTKSSPTDLFCLNCGSKLNQEVQATLHN